MGGALLGLLLAGTALAAAAAGGAIAERVTAGELDARIHAGGHDEVAKLGEAIDRMAEAMQQRIERERRFVADVAHDLRTPLTGLKTAASLLDRDQVGDAIRERVDRMRRLVEDLLEISRLDSGTATADLRRVDLGGFVAERGRRRSAGVTIRTNGASQQPGRPAPARARDRERARQRRPPRRAAGRGRGVARPDRGARPRARASASRCWRSAAERFTTGDPARGDGIGLGLAIAAGQCQVLGAELQLANDPGRRSGGDDRAAPGMSARSP